MTLKSTIFSLLILYKFSTIEHVLSQRDFDDALTNFARNLFKQIFSMNETNNFVVSPIAIQRQLLLVMQGAHGKTYSEIKKIIEFDGIDESSFVDTFAKKPTEFMCNDYIFKSQKTKLRMPFKLLSKLLFDVTPDEVNFKNVNQTAAAISETIEMASVGFIRKFIRSRDISPHTAMCFMNSALFGGQWETPFNKKNRMGKFYNYGNSQVGAFTLYGIKMAGYAQLADLKATALSLSYLESDEKLLILLPDDRNNLKAMFDKTMRTDFSLLIRKLRPKLVQLTVPLFSIDYRIRLSEVLPKLGAKTLLTPYADFENAFEDPIPANELCLYSKTHFDINNHGSSTDDANLKLKSTQLNEDVTPETFFHCEHPFIFFIHKNDVIHLFGRVSALNVQSADYSAEESPLSSDPTEEED